MDLTIANCTSPQVWTYRYDGTTWYETQGKNANAVSIAMPSPPPSWGDGAGHFELFGDGQGNLGTYQFHIHQVVVYGSYLTDAQLAANNDALKYIWNLRGVTLP
jgi:hypothetical protein